MANTGMNGWGDFFNSSSWSQKTIRSQGPSLSFLSFHENRGEKWTKDLFQHAHQCLWLWDEITAFPFYLYSNLVLDSTTTFRQIVREFFISVIYIYFHIFIYFPLMFTYSLVSSTMTIFILKVHYTKNMTTEHHDCYIYIIQTTHPTGMKVAE